MPFQAKRTYRLSCVVGTKLWIDEQLYTLVDFKPFIKANGDLIHNPVWETNCPRCGQKFRRRVRSGEITVINVLVRRCTVCADPGVKVADEAAGLNAVARELIKKIDLGLPGPRGKGIRLYSDHGMADERAAWKLLSEACAGRLSDIECRKIINEWVERGWLVRKKYLDPVTRREQSGLASGL